MNKGKQVVLENGDVVKHLTEDTDGNLNYKGKAIKGGESSIGEMIKYDATLNAITFNVPTNPEVVNFGNAVVAYDGERKGISITFAPVE